MEMEVKKEPSAENRKRSKSYCFIPPCGKKAMNGNKYLSKSVENMTTCTLPRKNDLQELRTGACRAGATEAAIVAAKDIVVEDELAERCRQPRCENYGLSRSCPPHVAGPVAFRKELESTIRRCFSGSMFLRRCSFPATTVNSSNCSMR